jgi:hypothetical protein
MTINTLRAYCNESTKVSQKQALGRVEDFVMTKRMADEGNPE